VLRRGAAGNAEVDQLDAILRVDHDVLGLQIAVHYASAVDVVECLADTAGDAQGPIGGNALGPAQNIAQEPPFHPLHHHVRAAAPLVGKDLHHRGVIQIAPDFLLLAEAVDQQRVVFHVGMGHFDGYHRAGAQIGSAKDRGHAAACGHAFETIMIELCAAAQPNRRVLLDGCHWLRKYGNSHKEGIKRRQKRH